MKLTWLQTRKGLKNRGNEWLEVDHPIRRRQDEEDTEGQLCDVLLQLDASIHGNEAVVFATHPPKEITVLDASPASPDDGGDVVPGEECGEVYRKLLVKKNTH